jgi:hypothetical protein
MGPPYSSGDLMVLSGRWSLDWFRVGPMCGAKSPPADARGRQLGNCCALHAARAAMRGMVEALAHLLAIGEWTRMSRDHQRTLDVATHAREALLQRRSRCANIVDFTQTPPPPGAMTTRRGMALPCGSCVAQPTVSHSAAPARTSWSSPALCTFVYAPATRREGQPEKGVAHATS